jgi:hypothetical protein
MARRGFFQRLRILWLFIFTTIYDKPNALPHRYQSYRWWREAWLDTSRLGS